MLLTVTEHRQTNNSASINTTRTGKEKMWEVSLFLTTVYIPIFWQISLPACVPSLHVI